MKIITRNGDKETVRLDAITERIKKACEYCNIDLYPVDPVRVAVKVVNSIRDNITTSELDDVTARICMNWSLEHPNWGTLGSRIIISNHQKNTHWSFSEAIEYLYNNKDYHRQHCPLVSKEIYDIVKNDPEMYNSIIKPERDFFLDYFGFKTLERSYLLRTSDKIIRETPSFLFLRVALGIWGNNTEKVEETYNMLSQKYATHATPTLFNSGTPLPQFSSCFLLGTEDSVDGIYKTITDCARISKWSGGIGFHISNIRCKGSYIRGTGGKTDGIIPMLKVYNTTARYIDQSGKRNGSYACYIEPWHGDIMSFLKAMRNHGSEESLARDLFYALWVPDCFMEAVKNDEDWFLMCPDECPGLNEVYGNEFEELYYKYALDGHYREKIKARDVWDEIIKSQIESGMPYMMYKDSINKKNNQKNLGTIKSSNLCAEITEYSNDKEYAVCNLASLCLPNFVEYQYFGDYNITIYTKDNCSWCNLLKVFFKQTQPNLTIEWKNNIVGFKTYPQTYVNEKNIGGFEKTIEFFRPSINYDKLESTIETLVENLNIIIDKNYYPTPETKFSNLSHRPMGIGVQGLSDMFAKMWIPYESKEASSINKELFESIYYFAVKKSIELAHKTQPYSSFENSPLSKGLFQFDHWGEIETTRDFETLRKQMIKKGIKNSLLIALMPTASTSQIMGNNESFEPFNSCMFVRRTLSGEFIVINKYLMSILHDLGIWNEEMKQRIMYHRGSIQKIPQIPQYIKEMYKTVWEIKKKHLINMSRERSPFVCQSQSFNLYFEDCNPDVLTKTHLYAWKQGLKTGSYYIRSRPATNAQNFTIDPHLEEKFKNDTYKQSECENCSG